MVIHEDLFWISSSTLDQETTLGGYSKILKESIKLSKRSKKILSQISNLSETETKDSGNLTPFDEISISYKISSFCTRLCNRTKKDIIFSNWQVPLTLPPHGPAKFKERLKLDHEDVDLLKCLNNLNTSKEIPLDVIKENSLEDYKLETMNLKSHHPKSILTVRPLSEEYMPSTISNNLEIFQEETLSNIDSFQFKKIPEKQPAANLDAVYKLILDLNIFTNSESKQAKMQSSSLSNLVTVVTWDFDKKLNFDKMDLILKNLETKLLDIQFNEFELYKLPLKSRHSPAPLLKKKRVDKKALYWNLDKIQLRQLDWDPFKLSKSFNLEKLFLRDAITLHKINFTKSRITFPKLFCSQLDLIIVNQIDNKNDMKQISIPINDSKSQPRELENNEVTELSERRQKLSESNISPTIENETTTFNSIKPQTDTSMLPQKRSFLDSDLLSIISKKKQRQIETNNLSQTEDTNGKSSISQDFTNAILPELELLNVGLITETHTTISNYNEKAIKKVEIGSNSEASTNNIHIEDIDLPIKIQDYLIIANSNQMQKNHQIINKLSNVQDINKQCHLLEFAIHEPVDFILNYQTCLIRVDITKFFQVDKSNRLYYHETISQLIPEYHVIVVLIEYREEFVKVDSDILWKILLFLPQKQFKLVYVEQNDLSFISTMQWIIQQYCSPEFQETEVTGLLETVTGKILTNLKLNPLLISQILKRYTFSELVRQLIETTTSDISESIEIHDWLTVTQLERLGDYVALEW